MLRGAATLRTEIWCAPVGAIVERFLLDFLNFEDRRLALLPLAASSSSSVIAKVATAMIASDK